MKNGNSWTVSINPWGGVPFSSPDSISIEFTAGANPIPIFNVDGCRDFNITWIDDLRLGTTLINDASEAGSSLAKQVKIAPNPSNGIFEIRQEDLHYNYAEIFDAQGRKVATLYLASTTERLRLGKRGLYFVRFFNGREEVPSLLKRVVVLN